MGVGVRLIMSFVIRFAFFFEFVAITNMCIGHEVRRCPEHYCVLDLLGIVVRKSTGGRVGERVQSVGVLLSVCSAYQNSPLGSLTLLFLCFLVVVSVCTRPVCAFA